MAKKALTRIEEGDNAVSVAHGCAALLDAALAEQLGPATAEEEGLDCGGRLAVRSARRLMALKHHLEVCCEALARIRDELRPWRERRERAREELYELVKDLRQLCRRIFKQGAGDTFLGLHGALPREPKELHAVLRPVIVRLADAEWSLPEVELKGFGLKREELLQSMRDLHEELGTALAAIQEGETREAVAQTAKDRAEATHAEFLGKSVRFLRASLELAGLDDLAAKVQPGAGRRGRPAKKMTAPASAALPGGENALSAAGEARLLAEGEADEGDDGD